MTILAKLTKIDISNCDCVNYKFTFSKEFKKL